MKKLLSIIIVIVIAAPFFTACKKGENDPGLSLKSRKARLVGEWELTDMERTTTSTSSGSSSTTTITFNGSTKTTTNSGGSTTSTYSESMEIIKDGTYKSKSSESDEWGTTNEDGEGTWAWVSGNKDDEYKSKERVCFTVTSSTSTYTSTGYSNTDLFTASGDASSVSIMKIDKLGSKELVITRDYNSNNDGNTYIVSETLTYEKK